MADKHTDGKPGFARAGTNTSAQPKTPILIPSKPREIATEFVWHRYTINGHRTLYNQQGVYYWWDGAGYRSADPQVIRSQIWGFLHKALQPGKNGPVPFDPSASKVTGVQDALQAVTTLSRDVQAPAWLDGRTSPPATECVALANGILHVRTRTLHEPSPLFWTMAGLPFDFAPNAPEPKEWERFLESVWPDDPDSITALQEMFGYMVTGDTSQQKVFSITGPKRSGKGTIARVLQGVVGKENCAAPTLNSLSQNFGLQPLIGTNIASISDARLSGRTDKATVTERLLSISGEDSITIDRKYLTPWTGKLGARFLILSNELPALTDASGALASRFIMFVMHRSFYGQEDPNLTDRLMAELPSIFNWALDGLDRLHERGYFRQPDAGKEAVEELEEIGSPIKAFIRERCEVGPGLVVSQSELFNAWQGWCRQQGREFPGTIQTFGRNLNAAEPSIRRKQRRDGTGRTRVYEGIALVQSTDQPADPDRAATEVVHFPFDTGRKCNG